MSGWWPTSPRFLGRSPDRAEPEDLRRYQLHLAAQGASPGKMNAAVSALRFFCRVTLGRPAFGERLARVRQRERLPVVLSPEEVALLLHCAPGLKHKAALSVAYGCGLRASEIVHLKVSDIPRVQPSAGPRTGSLPACWFGSSRARAVRTATSCSRPTSWTCFVPRWRETRPRGWLFPGRDPAQPTRTPPRPSSRVRHLMSAAVPTRPSLPRRCPSATAPPRLRPHHAERRQTRRSPAAAPASPPAATAHEPAGMHLQPPSSPARRPLGAKRRPISP